MRTIEGKDNYGRPKIEYVKKVAEMPYEELMREAEHTIWLSAYAANNPRSDYHWHVDVCYAELIKRDGNDKGYVKAWKRASGQ